VELIGVAVLVVIGLVLLVLVPEKQAIERVSEVSI
jgi:hypothetical protein